MASEFSIIYYEIELVNKESKEKLLKPYMVLSVPGSKPIRESYDEKIMNKYEWKKQYKFLYKVKSKKQLIEDNCYIEIYSGDISNTEKSIFLGDIVMDMFSLTHGPTKHKIELLHSSEHLYLNFTFESIQKSYTEFHLSKIIIPKITDSLPILTYSLSGRKLSETVTSFNEYSVDELISDDEKIPKLKIPLMMADVINPSLTLNFELKTNDNNELGYCSFGICALYKRNIDECVILEGNIKNINNDKKYKIQAELMINNFPRACVTPGYHIYENNLNIYKDIVIQEGTNSLKDKIDIPFLNSNIYSNPCNDSQVLEYPIIYEININSIHCHLVNNINNSQNSLNDLFIQFYSSYGSSSLTKLIKQKNMKDINSYMYNTNIYLPPISTKRPYLFRNQYLTVEMYKGNNNKRMIIGNYKLNIHTLLSGGTKYELKLDINNNNIQSVGLEFNVNYKTTENINVQLNDVIIDNYICDNDNEELLIYYKDLNDKTIHNNDITIEDTRSIFHNIKPFNITLSSTDNKDNTFLTFLIREKSITKYTKCKISIPINRFIPIDKHKELTIEMQGRGIEITKPITIYINAILSNTVNKGIVYSYIPYIHGVMMNSGLYLDDDNYDYSNRLNIQPYYPSSYDEIERYNNEERDNNSNNVEELLSDDDGLLVTVISSSIDIPHFVIIYLKREEMEIYNEENNKRINSIEYGSLECLEYHNLVEIYSCDLNLVIFSPLSGKIEKGLKRRINNNKIGNSEDLFSSRRFTLMENKESEKEDRFVNRSIMTSIIERNDKSKYLHVRSLSYETLNFLDSQNSILDLEPKGKDKNKSNEDNDDDDSENMNIPYLVCEECGKFIQLQCPSCKQVISDNTVYDCGKIKCLKCNKTSNITRKEGDNDIDLFCLFCNNILHPKDSEFVPGYYCCCGQYINGKCDCGKTPSNVFYFKAKCKDCGNLNLVDVQGLKCASCDGDLLDFHIPE